MSAEIAVPGKTVRYLNLDETGALSGETSCDVDSRWTMPILDKQSEYLVAISRFEVPLNRIPMIAALENCIEIYKYHDEDDQKQGPVIHVRDSNNQIVDGLGGRGALSGVNLNPAVGRAAGELYFDTCEGIGLVDNNRNPHLSVTQNDPNGAATGKGHAISITPSYTVYEGVMLMA